jgi:hypothetical protein
MAEAAPAAPPAAPQWIVSRRYDLAWFFGGALASLAVLALHFAAHVPIVVLFWTWILAFDGPHIGAAFTRTYVDREEWRSRRRVLLVSLLSFAVGPLFLALNLATGSPDPFLLFLGAATFYGYYHVVRQHYGFLALYKARNRDGDRVDFRIDRAFLYVGCWAPYFYFLLTHPKARVLLHLSPNGPTGTLERAAVVLCLGVWGAALLAFLVRLFARPRERLRQPQTAYLLITVLLYSVVYFFVARFEPVYAQSNGPDQDFLLLSVVVVIFHNVQYLGLVWFHNRNRYGAPADADFGAARPLNRSIGTFLLACLIFSGVVYLGFAASTGVFPVFHFGLNTRWGSITLNQLGLCLWWGLAINHYYLDQKIWRIRGDGRLKKNLGLA